ncbi:hypothetical protein LHJ74_30670 [Streptomyces sp. N2-109]|uniref:Terminase small subunit n=1 Tax=Streptomyces gossypii TaxID=2883101 RepID=A0ABT2K3X6_9ACTN|nr:hypothetical protein [Streptomyces gossypii]MCT2594220.1 hypothetical protein [Streptomyces gossypii]
MSGPVPKRSDQRVRRNTPEGPAVVKAPAGESPGIPQADPDWHPIALRWYEALTTSGQAQFYEASDWATAQYVAEAMSRNLAAEKRFSAQLFQAVMSAMTDLLTTEGARRRARVELERETGPDPAEAATLTLMDSYRKAAGGGDA